MCPVFLLSVAGGYAPRDAVSKLRGISYSRSIMSVCLPVGGDEEESGGDNCDSCPPHSHTQPQWTAQTR